MRKPTPVLLLGLALPIQALAASTATGISPTGSMLKMVLGLAVVLAVMALVSWAVKRMLPGAMGQQSAIRIVGGVSVGSRERVVVLEVADRWIVVGVAPGQVNGIANLEVGETMLSEQLASHVPSNPSQSTHQPMVHPMMQPLVKPFSEWLKKSAEAASTKLGGKPDVKE
ncbi:MAG TPA: flagellar biosynthetic protein FliO [Methylophilus sp.]|nr:flagellar biosynthetic protein FliO [Methylophilus sp.]HQQ32408.1 flagellar biosynthetic protein FliO [Methylophilus sp.]